MSTAQASTQIISLTDPQATNHEQLGGKAATLAVLTQRGFRVPQGAALPAEWSVEHLQLLDGCPNRQDYPDFRAWAAAMHRAIGESTPSADLQQRLAELVAAQPATEQWIVRSSAVGEDSAELSFAGQLDSVVTSDGALADAVVEVWASAWGSRAALYRQRHGLEELNDLQVGVLIQPYLTARAAGVLFTSSPTHGQDGPLIEAVLGQGATLVGGEAAPERYYLSSGGDLAIDEGAPRVGLDRELVERLMLTGREIEEVLGGPQDIEWLVDPVGVLWIVQSRPITTLAAAAEVNPDHFAFEVIQVRQANEEQIPGNLAERDKFRLRLLADRARVTVGRGWLVRVTSNNSGSDRSLAVAASTITSQVERSPQVSFVLQDPARLDGEIIRQFSRLDEVQPTLEGLLRRIAPMTTGSSDLIATEIYAARMSGIAHLTDGRLAVEVAFGSYVPKGVVPTSLYVVNEAGTVESMTAVVQDTAVYIEDGAPVERRVDNVARLDEMQLGTIRQMTQAVSDEYPDVSVEFGVLADGTPYLIDIIPDMSPVQLNDVRVMSPGAVAGVAEVHASDELADRSLDAHFHSQRSESEEGDGASVIIVAPRPFLALEEHLAKHGSGSLGFVFEQGSLLGHLAIVLREHKVPAIVIPGALELIRTGAFVSIDTNRDELLQLEDPFSPAVADA